MPQDSYLVEQIPGMLELWDKTKGDPSIRIGVLDTYIDENHDCFKGSGLELVNVLKRPKPSSEFDRNHGTHVASLIFGQHMPMFKGVSPGCSGFIIPIYDFVNSQLVCSQEDLAIAIKEAVDLSCRVICISGGQLQLGSYPDGSLVAAVEYANKNNSLVVSAAGNDGCFKCYHIPGSIPDVLVVGAMDKDGLPLTSSNWGPDYSKQGVLAPGKNILGASSGGGFKKRTGTSFATPIVAGIAGLFASYQLSIHNRIDMRLIKEAILNTAIVSDCEEGNDGMY